MLFRGGLADKVKRTVIFHFIETSARSVPLFLLLSLHVSLISSLQATQIPSLLHILTVFHTGPKCLLFLPLTQRQHVSSLTLNSPFSCCNLQPGGFGTLWLAWLSGLFRFFHFFSYCLQYFLVLVSIIYLLVSYMKFSLQFGAEMTEVQYFTLAT